ncbi:MAG: permease [Bacillota bacterium]
MTFNEAIWGLTLVLLCLSGIRDPKKARLALKEAWMSFENILPQFIGIIFLISIMLAFLTPNMITQVVGRNTGFWGMLLTSVIGAVTLVPAFIAFPLAKSLVSLGAGIPQIAVLVSTLMMVGIVTMPVEIKFFGKRVTFTRNGLAYLASFLVAWVIGVVVK